MPVICLAYRRAGGEAGAVRLPDGLVAVRLSPPLLERGSALFRPEVILITAVRFRRRPPVGASYLITG